jgi:hypothetical protein
MDGGLTIARFDPAEEWPETEEELTALFGPRPPPVQADPAEIHRQMVALIQLYPSDPRAVITHLDLLVRADKKSAGALGRYLAWRVERLPADDGVRLHDAIADEYHRCIEALHRARKPGDPPLNRDTVWERGKAWLLEHHYARAYYTPMRLAFGDPRHATKRRLPGQH